MPNGSVVSQVKLYNGATHIGSGTVTGNTVRVTTDVVLPKDTAVTLTAKLVLKPITNESQSGVSNKLTLTKIGYQTNNGNSKTVSTSLSGNDVVSYKALFSMKRIPFSGVIDTTQQQTLYEGEITTYGDAVGFKQFGFNVLLSDIVGSGAFQDTIYVDSLAFFFGSNQVLNGVFLNALGQPITMITEADTKIYFVITSGAHELIVPAGQSIRFKLKGRAHGLKHPSDGDLVKVALAPDLTPVPAGYKFANRGAAGANMKLYNSPLSSGSAVPINIGWTDFSAGSAHSAAYTTSSGDFYSSYGFDVATDAQVLSQ
jgi:hypothetical protein